MKLYRIRDVRTSKFLGGWRWYNGREIWSQSGAFYRRPETIIHHLQVLCSNKQFQPDARGTKVYPVVKYDRRKLKNYRVVIDEVECKGQSFVHATTFMRKK